MSNCATCSNIKCGQLRMASWVISVSDCNGSGSLRHRCWTPISTRAGGGTCWSSTSNSFNNFPSDRADKFENFFATFAVYADFPSLLKFPPKGFNFLNFKKGSFIRKLEFIRR